MPARPKELKIHGIYNSGPFKYGASDGWLVTGFKTREQARKRARELALGQRGSAMVVIKDTRGYTVIDRYRYEPKSKKVRKSM